MDRQGEDGADVWRSAFDHGPVGMAVCSPDGVALRVNPQLARLLGRPADEILASSFTRFTHEDDLAAALEACTAFRRGLEVSQHEVRFVRPDGDVVTVLVCASTVPGRDDGPTSVILHFEDITARVAREAELLRRAQHDPLTGLPNRALFVDRLRRTLQRAERDGTATAVLFVDLDHFKPVNDTLGHATGDLVLLETARRLQEAVRPGDVLARHGGDEFTVVCAGADASEGAGVAARIRRAMMRPFVVDGYSLNLTASVGIADAVPGDAVRWRAEDLIAAADRDMYRNKDLLRREAGRRRSADAG